jgi:hypothetical protein
LCGDPFSREKRDNDPQSQREMVDDALGKHDRIDQETSDDEEARDE